MHEIDFLPVGDGERSGDAIAMRFQTASMLRPAIVVVDGGYQANGAALASHIRSYYRVDHVDLVVSTHPDADHINGLITLLDEMSVSELMMHRPWRQSTDMESKVQTAFKDRAVFGDRAGKFERSMAAAADLEETALRQGVPVAEPFAGEVRYDGALMVVGPTMEYYESLLPDFRKGKARGAGTAEVSLARLVRTLGGVVAPVREALHIESLTDDGVTSAENDSSVILHLALDGQRLLLTGDAGMPALTHAADYMDARDLNTGPLSLIQVPTTEANAMSVRQS